MTKLIESILYVAISAVPILLTQLLKKRYRKLMEPLKPKEDEFFHQIIFLNMNNFDCRQHFYDRQECSEKCSYSQLQTLIKFIASAKTSISFCMYILTLKQINLELLRAHRRGVKVRLITDKVMLETSAAKNNIEKLIEIGIPFKVQHSDQVMMHHKFCLIDKEDAESAKMFFGSLNLTAQGVTLNFDSIVLTNNINIISKFSDEFEEMWTNFQ